MRVFVASWFFPPSTSSEGIVAYKLLSNSKNSYDVCSSLSHQWGFEATLPLTSPNITPATIQTDEISEWIDFAVDEFERRHEEEAYDCIMTRSMPPESIEVGRRIKEKHPDLPWVASLGDPISRVPHMIRDLIDKNKNLKSADKSKIKLELDTLSDCSRFLGKYDESVDVICNYKQYEVTALRQADMLIFPNSVQANYMLCGLRRDNVVIIPHSFDEKLYPNAEHEERECIELVFSGYAYSDRSVEPIVQGLHMLEINNPEAANKLRIRFIGNISDNSRSLTYNYYLHDRISFEGNVSYLESLRIMRDADWLIHVDGYSAQFKETGGSVYLAGKLSDYIGAGKPILALTGKHSPADRLIERYGGSVLSASDKAAIADILEQIALGDIDTTTDSVFASQFKSTVQANRLDEALAHLITAEKHFDSKPIVQTNSNNDEKLLTISIAAYNVESTLSRALDSLIACKKKELLDIIIVNDGSSDKTLDIAKQYQESHPGIIRIIDKPNGGHGSTINAGIDSACGQYFRVLDGDDWLDPSSLDDFLGILEALSVPVDLISTDYCQINMTTGKINRIKKKSDSLSYNTVYHLSRQNIETEYFSLGSTTYRTKILRDCGIKLFENCFYVDVQYQMYPLPFINTIMFTEGNLYHYSIGSSDQSIGQQSFVDRYYDHDRVVCWAIEYYFDNYGSMCENARKYYEGLITNHFLKTHYMISIQFDDDKLRAGQRVKSFDEFLEAVSPEWYKTVGELYPAVTMLRKYSYDFEKSPAITSLNSSLLAFPKRAARKAIRVSMKGIVGKTIADEVTKRQKKR